MQAMPGIRGTGSQGLHTADERVKAELQGETEVAGAMPRVREGDGGGVTGGAPPNPARRGKRGVRTGGRRRIRGRRSQNL